MIMIFLGRREDRRIKMTAMARPATHRHARILHLAHVVRVDVLDHFVHQPCRVLLRLRVIGEIQPRFPVGANVFGIGGMAGAALSAQRGFPLVHEVVNLLAGHGLREDLEVGRCWFFMVMRGFAGRRLLSGRSLTKGGDGKDCRNQGRKRGGKVRGRKLQVHSSSRF